MNPQACRLNVSLCASLAAASVALLGLTGCFSPHAAAPAKPATAGTNILARSLSAAILDHPFPADGEASPLVAMLGIRNFSGCAYDVGGLAGRLTDALAASGKVRFADPKLCAEWLAREGLRETASREDIGFKMARHLGANYVMTGWVAARREPGIQGRPQNAGALRVTVEISDVKTGLVVLRKSSL